MRLNAKHGNFFIADTILKFTYMYQRMIKGSRG